MDQELLTLKKVRVHNLKNVDLVLNKNELIVFTGVSGSGKSSLAFDTIYTEGQRRYVESLSTFARRQMGDLSKPDFEHASGITPTISIEQKTAGRNPRSTVGTLTEIYDYLRLLFARVGIPHCPISGQPVAPQSKEKIIQSIQELPLGTKLSILAPYANSKKAEFKEDFQELLRKGFTKVRVDGEIVELNDSLILDSSKSHDVDIVIDRLVISKDGKSRVAESVSQALEFGKGLCRIIDAKSGQERLFSMHAFSEKSGLSYPPLEPQDFSFNSPSGMCKRCNGIGTIHEFNLDLILDKSLSIKEDCCSVASSYQTVRYGNIYENLASLYNFSTSTPWKNLSEQAKKVFLFGSEKKWLKMHFVHPVTGSSWTDHIQWKGVLHEAKTRFSEAKSDLYRKKMEALMSIQRCPECNGSRLQPYPAATLLKGKRIYEVTAMTIADTAAFFSNLCLEGQEKQIASELLKEIEQRLHFLLNVGLHYLTLDRTAPTLSGGEAQRVRLASQIGCGLVGITYVLDEPSIGLHPRDNTKLIETLKKLKEIGNTVIVVEHDEETVWSADRIVDFGPGAGIQGGEILVNGSLKDLLTSQDSLTGAYLSGRKEIAIPKKRRKKTKEALVIKGATHHNLKGIDVSIPLGLFVAITGVSGSGKSSLITEILYPALSNLLSGGEHAVGAHKTIEGIDYLEKVIAIDQSPIGRSSRSNPATYVKLFDEIRDLFASLPESQRRGYKLGRFSFNVKEGSCTECEGMGEVKIEMDFLEDAFCVCPLCKGKRFDEETLSIQYKGKNIYEVLEMDVAEALEFFDAIPSIKNKLTLLQKVGLDYMKLGQSSTTLSGGEAQRIKLAKELVRPSSGKTLYIMDEPTTGLHFHDVNQLLGVLQSLVDKGNTLVVIEHNMDVVKTADFVIDLGPEGGEGGGQIVAKGTPEDIAKMDTPTGHAVKNSLFPNTEKKVQEALKSKKTKKKEAPVSTSSISIIDAEQNNLKSLSVSIPREKMIVFTGPSGSGKSSLAFETLYAEGQRRYIESLSPYARQFVKQMDKPKARQITGLSPAIAIEQKSHAGNPRSTIGTMTEIYDYLRILYARVGTAHCPETGEKIQAISKEHVLDYVLAFPEKEKIHILAPIELRKNESFSDFIQRIKREGYIRIRLNGTIYAIDNEEEAASIPFNNKRKNELQLVIDRLKNDPAHRSRLFEAIEKASEIGGKKILVLKGEDKEILFNLSFTVESTGKSYPEITPRTFAFNTQEGMCIECQGIGYQHGADFLQQPEMLYQSPLGLVNFLWGPSASKKAISIFEQVLDFRGADFFVQLKHLSQEALHLLMNGADEPIIISQSGLKLKWNGINPALAKAAKHGTSAIKEQIRPFMNEHTCPSCEGARINPLARHVTINKTPIHALCALSIKEVLDFIEALSLKKEDKKILEEVYEQIVNRLHFLCEIGLHYLSLNRSAPTLSGGEGQRIRLARQLGSGLTGALYVLDEPTVGLHPADNHLLNEALQKLKKLHNTLVLVEHDPLTIASADYILDFGPASGEEGGYITAQGSLKEILENSDSLTGAYLSGRKEVPLPQKRRPLSEEGIVIKDADKNNLKNITAKFPLRVLTCLTGVSGSGKSTLLEEVLLPAFNKFTGSSPVIIGKTTVTGLEQFDKLIFIDQNPVGHTVRSDVGTYVDLLPKLREFFIKLPLARMKGLEGKHFSYNHKRGMCTGCWGLGYKKIEMHFLPDVKVVCEECKGLRLNPISLEVKYKDRSFGHFLETTVEEARKLLSDHRSITRILDTLIRVGLGYVRLGQETASLSGGEAQRLKLSRELIKRSTGNTLYLLDEPTTGLHSDDIVKLVKVLQELVDKGNTMIIIEHNLDMIKNADYIIDLGPEAGKKGGYIIAEGTPEELVKNKKSITGSYLKNSIRPRHEKIK